MNISPGAQRSIQKVIERFQSGDLSPITHVVRMRLDPAAPARKWSLSNKILAYIQANELDCRGFGQWKDVGRYIKKGSHAVYIVRPLTVRDPQANDQNDEEQVRCVGFSTIPVFAASDTQGPGPLPSYTPIELPPLIGLAQKFGIDVAYVPTSYECFGDTTASGDKIRLGTHDPSVFFHELAHAIHARIEGGLKGGQQVDQETIAEFTSVVLMDLYGLGDRSGNAWRYIQYYSTDPLIAITKSLGTIEKIMNVLFDSEGDSVIPQE